MATAKFIETLENIKYSRRRTHLQLVPRSRKCGPIHPLPHTPSWRSAELVKHKDNFTFTRRIPETVKVKVKISLLQALKAHRVARG
jgi:hypothetical protein